MSRELLLPPVVMLRRKDACGCAYATKVREPPICFSGVADAYFDSLPVIFITGQLNTYEYSGIAGPSTAGAFRRSIWFPWRSR